MAATDTRPQSAEDLLTLAGRLREKGLSDDELRDALGNLGGFNKAQIGRAVAETRPAPAPAPPSSPALPVDGAGETAPGGDRGGSNPRTPRQRSPRGSGRGAGLGSILGRGSRSVDRGLNDARTLTLTPPRRLTVRSGAGFVGGLFLFVLGLNYLRYGPEGVKGWLAAKFLNRPMTGGETAGKGIGTVPKPDGPRRPGRRRRDRGPDDPGPRDPRTDPDPGQRSGVVLPTTRARPGALN